MALLTPANPLKTFKCPIFGYYGRIVEVLEFSRKLPVWLCSHAPYSDIYRHSSIGGR
jgi:hypothetical protein